MGSGWGPGQVVEVERIDLAEGRAHAAGLDQQTRGQRGEGGEALLELDALLAESEEHVGACVGIDDGLEGELGLAQLRGRQVLHGVVAADREEITDQRDAGIEVVRGLRRPAGGRRDRLRRRCGANLGNGGFGRQGLWRRRSLQRRSRLRRDGCLPLSPLDLGKALLQSGDALLVGPFQLLDLPAQRRYGIVRRLLGPRDGGKGNEQAQRSARCHDPGGPEAGASRARIGRHGVLSSKRLQRRSRRRDDPARWPRSHAERAGYAAGGTIGGARAGPRREGLREKAC